MSARAPGTPANPLGYNARPQLGIHRDRARQQRPRALPARRSIPCCACCPTCADDTAVGNATSRSLRRGPESQVGSGAAVSLAGTCGRRLRSLVRAAVAPSPPGFDPMLGLRAIGYDVRRPDAAIDAFRTHHTPAGSTGEPIERDGALIQCLAGKSLEQ